MSSRSAALIVFGLLTLLRWHSAPMKAEQFDARHSLQRITDPIGPPAWCQHLSGPRKDICGSTPQRKLSHNELAWHTLKIGPAAYMSGLDLIASDDTAAVREDQYGCAIQTTSVSAPVWRQLLTVQTMPNDAVTDPTGAPIGAGCDEIVIDPSNTSNLWLETNGNLYKSINRGGSFTKTNYPSQPAILSPAHNKNVKSFAPYIAVDPKNSRVVYASTPTQGLEFTSDGGISFSRVSAVSAGITPNGAVGTSASRNTINSQSCEVGSSSCTLITNLNLNYGTGNYVQVWETANPANQIFGRVKSDSGASLVLTVLSTEGSGTHSDWSVSGELGAFNNNSGGGNIVTFDKSGGVTLVNGQSRTANVYACAYGIGVYASKDGGQTWSLTANGPARCHQMVADPTGTLWLVADGAHGIWSYSGAVWTQDTLIAPYAGNALAVAVDTNHCASRLTCHVAVAGDGVLHYTVDGGRRWNTESSPSYTANDVPWMAGWYSNFGFLGVGGIKFDSTGRLFWSDEGVWYTVPHTDGSKLALTSQGEGIEGIEGDSIISTSTTSGGVFVGAWDIGCFYSKKFASYPTNQNCYEQHATGLSHVYSMTGAPRTPNFVAALADNQGGGAAWASYSGTSTDNGERWSSLRPPTEVVNAKNVGGCIAASSSSNILWAQADGGSGTHAPYFTIDGGLSWRRINVAGVTAGWPYRYYDINRICAADTVIAGVFYIYVYPNGVPDALVKCTSGGASCFIVSRPQFGADASFNSVLKTVPGQAGYLFLSWGTVVPPKISEGGLFYSSNGGLTLLQVRAFSGVTAFGFGAEFPGHAFPSIWVAGWYNKIYGIWRCEDWDGAKTWRQVGDGYPNGWAMPIYELDGDKGIPQQVYGVTGSGAFYGYIQ